MLLNKQRRTVSYNTVQQMRARNPSLLSAGMLALYVFLCLYSFSSIPAVSAGAPDLYCGMKNCYEILSVTPEASASEIKKAYFKLSLIYHPDKFKDPDPVKVVEALEIFREVTTAYEVLSDAESRKNYDEALLHPERFFENQYRYYQHRYKYAKQTDARIILLITLIVVSLLHYYYWVHRYKKMRVALASAPLIVTRMRNKVKSDLLDEKTKAGVKNPQVSKEEIDERVKLEDVSNYGEIASWDGRHPTWKDTIPVWLVTVPYRLSKFLYWHGRYFILYSVLKHEYGPEEADYATSVALGMEFNKWIKGVDAAKRAELSALQLWIPKNLESWKRSMMASKKKTW